MKTQVAVLLFIFLQAAFVSAQNQHHIQANVAEVYELTQSYKFMSADSLLKQISSNQSNPFSDLARANYLWWMIISGEDNKTNRQQYVLSSDAAIRNLNDKPVESLSDEQLYTVITGYGNKARIEGLNKSYVKGFMHINTCLKYIKRSFGREQRFSYFTLTTGLYNYYMSTANRNFPVLLPYLSLFPSGDLKKGIQMLEAAANNSNKLLSTEGHYFLMKLFMEEKDLRKAELHCNWLLKQYPDNLLYNYYIFRILLDQKKKDEALEALSALRFKEMMNRQLTPLQKKYYSGLATKDLKEYYLKNSN